MQQMVTKRPVWPEGVALLFGVGAQKAGTTWVHRYLNQHPACRQGPVKELLYFDTLEGIGKIGDVLRSRNESKFERLGKKAKLEGVKRLQAICESPDPNHQSYVDLVTDGLAPGQVALDITPSYALLETQTFRQMAGLGDTRFLFLMREPVSRHWSAIRMMVANRPKAPDDFEAACQRRLDVMLESDQIEKARRADYVGTLDRLVAAVPAERRLVMFCENLFTQDAADRICDFLGIAHHKLGDLGVVNEGQKASMRPDQVVALTEKLRPQYDAVCAAFGDEVPQAWHKRFAVKS